MNTRSYDRTSAINYAQKWALSRNPKYYNFDSVGGDCTSFVSQCLFAGSKKMNYSHVNGWYYNNGYGPRGQELSQAEIMPGDIAQLSFDGTTFGHSLFIINVNGPSLNNIAVATHTYDVLGKKIGEYNFLKVRFIHIENVRI